MFRITLLLLLLSFISPEVLALKANKIIMNPLSYGRGTALTGDTFEMQVAKLCTEYYKAIQCNVCEDLSKKRQERVRLIEEKLLVIAEEDMDAEVRKCLRCKALINSPDNYLGQKCEDRSETVYIKLPEVESPPLDQQCPDSKGELFPCGEESKAALQKLLENKIINCQDVAISNFVEAGKLMSVKTCRIDDKDLSQTLMAQGWVHRDVDSSPDLTYLEDKARHEKKGLWR